jgi:hypothetical protein
MEDLPAWPFMHTPFARQAILAKDICHPIRNEKSL